jgi:hypothetical protein
MLTQAFSYKAEETAGRCREGAEIHAKGMLIIEKCLQPNLKIKKL